MFQIDADPDVLPRTHSFGLDYMAFAEMVPVNTPPTFLRLAFDCCVVSISNGPLHDRHRRLNYVVSFIYVS